MKHFRKLLKLIVVALIVFCGIDRVAAQSKVRWCPTSGTILLAGGGLSSSNAESFGKHLIALAGGPNATIVIIPTADPNMPPQINPAHTPSDPNELKKLFESFGAKHVAILHTRDRKIANSEAFVKVLRSANAVFMTGGQSLLLENTYRGTLVNAEMKALLARGGVVAGDSAGAIAIGGLWLTWLPEPFGKRADELDILQGVAISPHANKAKGYVTDHEVLKYLAGHSTITGINIDENTILILNKDGAQVLGAGRVSILDASKDKTKPALILKGGEKYIIKP